MSSQEIHQAARQLGFDLVGIAPAVSPPGWPRLTDWLDRGFAGEMHYLEKRREAYQHPQHVLESVRSLIVLGSNYYAEDPLPTRESTESTLGRVSRYASLSEDYHDVLRQRLKQLAEEVRILYPGSRTRGVVDTAPLLERDFARFAGLGWYGKNTMLINKQHGSWFFISVLLTDCDLVPDAPFLPDHCGTCTRCLEACPTEAFPEPGVLDARRCISYLTIELRGPIPLEFRSSMGDLVFGCDICQDVCPWNRKAKPNPRSEWSPLPDLQRLELLPLFEITEELFQSRFGKTALARPGRRGLLRNAAIVLGNRKDPAALPALQRGLNDPDSVVREACQWAIDQIRTKSEMG